MRLHSLAANANVLYFGDKAILFSYETPVAAFVPGRGYLRTSTKWSQTTSRHIKKWLVDRSSTEVPQEEIENLIKDI